MKGQIIHGMRLTEPFHHALPVQEQLFHEGLYVTHVGWERILPGQPYPNPDHPPFYFFQWEEGRVLPAFCAAWVVEGCGEFQTKDRQRSVAKGEVFLILPGEWHRHRPDPETGWVLAWIEFNGTLPFRWWKEGAFGEDARFPTVTGDELFALQFEALLDHVHRRPTANSSLLSWTAIGVLSHLMRDSSGKSEGGGTGDPLVDRAIGHVWNFSHGILDVPEVARHVGVGRRSLERRFRATVGHGVLEEIQRCRYARAVRLLVETDLPVKVIVDRAGFGSHEHLRRLFRKFGGMTPDAYRRKNTKAVERNLE